jgi:hypothetical protein
MRNAAVTDAITLTIVAALNRIAKSNEVVMPPDRRGNPMGTGSVFHSRFSVLQAELARGCAS